MRFWQVVNTALRRKTERRNGEASNTKPKLENFEVFINPPLATPVHSRHVDRVDPAPSSPRRPLGTFVRCNSSRRTKSLIIFFLNSKVSFQVFTLEKVTAHSITRFQDDGPTECRPIWS